MKILPDPAQSPTLVNRLFTCAGDGIIARGIKLDVPYKLDGDQISQTIDTGCGVLTFLAENIRKQKTGVHAKVYIGLWSDGKSRILEWSVFNVERASERSPFAGNCFKKVSGIFKEVYPEIQFRAAFDEFCRGLFAASMGFYTGDLLGGTVIRKPRDFILKPYVIRGAGTIIYAPPDRGKSYLGLLMAICIDAGISKFWPAVQRRVMFINLERGKELVRERIGGVNRALGLSAERPLYTLSARGRPLADLKDACEYGIKENGIEVVLLDSISRTGYGTLVEDQTANTVIDTLSYLCPTWIAIAHTSKADDSRIYGSTMFEAGVDVGIQLITEAYENKLGIGLKIRKANDIRKPGKMDILALSFDELGLTGARWADDGEFGAIEDAERPDSNFKQVLEYLRSSHEQELTVKLIADTTGLKYDSVDKVLHRHKDIFRVVGRDPVTQANYWGIITHRYDGGG